MGLDISYYSKLTAEPNAEPDEYGDFDCDLFVVIDGDQERRASDLEPGVYSSGKNGGFRAGSYGGYNAWRDALAKFAGYPSAQHVWDHRDAFAGRSFVELIDFSDCEGVIGPKASAKLAADFAAHQDLADKHPDEYWRSKYADWREAFDAAADGGCVCFH